MFFNYLKTAFRNLTRLKVYSLINITGLAIGMAACLMILLYIQWELSFENMHSQADRIYRVLTIDKALGTHSQRVGITMPPFGSNVAEAFPEVEAGMRLTGGGRTLLRYEDQPGIYAEQMRSADGNFFDFFDYPLLAGDPATALSEPFSVVLTASLARQIFGDEEALGKVLQTGDGNDLEITGILQDLPDNTHLDFDALESMKTRESVALANQPPDSPRPIWLREWRMIAMPTYIKVVPGAQLDGIEERMTQFTYDNGVGENFEITLQPLNDVHLHSADVIFDLVTNKGDINNVYIFAAIALLTLIIAAVNYMNLATARSTERAREVGIRKVVGSMRLQLTLQFIGESIFLTLLALILSIPLVQLALPWLNNLAGSSMSFEPFQNGLLTLFLFAMWLLVGVVAGIYPALVLSSFRPVTVLKGSFKSGRKGVALRKALVVFQFSLSIALIGATAIIQKQMHYIQHKDIGYQRDQVAVFDFYDQSMGEGVETFREELLRHSAFSSAAAAGNIPGRTFGRTRVRPEGAPEEDIWIWSRITVSPEFLPTLGMEIVEGRNFSREMATDTSGVVLINETAVAQLGWDNPLERRLFFGPQDSVGTQIIGIVKDFHFAGLQQHIEPVVCFPMRNFPGALVTARIQPGRIPEALEHAEEVWTQVFPRHPFAFRFIDDEFDNLYRRDVNTSKVVNLFAALAILIACLGLFGLASHSTAQRTKEIGIRKVMGASTGLIIRLLMLDFIRWVALANLIAWPLAWYASSRWLENFAYRVSVDPVPLVIASLIALVIAALTILGHSWHAATLNPSDSIRYE